MQFCEMGMVYGTCCGKNQDTEKLHKGYLRVKYDGEEYIICEGCLTHFDYEDYKEDTEVIDIKTGKDVTFTIRAWECKY